MSFLFIPMAFMAVVFFVLFATVFVFVVYNIYGALTGRQRMHGPFRRIWRGHPFIPFDVNDRSAREKGYDLNGEQMPGHHHNHHHNHAPFPSEQPHHHHHHDASQHHHVHHQHHDMSPPPAPTFDAGSSHHSGGGHHH